MAINYKILFEIKLLHQYFLTGQDGITIFEKPDQDARLKYLYEQFILRKEAIDDFVTFSFPEHLKELYEGYNLRLLSTYSGCKVAVRVQKYSLADGSVVYKPLTPLSDDIDIFIAITNKSGGLGRFSSGNLNNSLPAKYLFSNDAELNPKTVPFLTSNVPAHDFMHPYEQGELASFGSSIQEFYSTTSGESWIPVPAKSLANESDRLLVPTKFEYAILSTQNITAANWILKDGNGNTIKTVSISDSQPLRKVSLDFSDKAEQISVQQRVNTPASVYSLEFSGNNGLSKNHKIVFSDTLSNRNNWGVIHIKLNPSEPLFKLIDNNGFIIKRKTPGGDVPHPVFEIGVRSRSAYWRFLNDRDKDLKLLPELEDYLEKDEKTLITKRPRTIARDYFMLSNDANASQKKYFPNPENYMLGMYNGRICFDIRVPESTLFPVV